MKDKDEALGHRYHRILSAIGAAAREAGRDPSTVQLLAVSKKQPASAIRELYELGQRDFGENYALELVEKAKELEGRGCSGIRWHFIGHIQTNKIKALIPYVSSVHAVDSERVATGLALHWRAKRQGAGRQLPIFLEVNISGEASKSGLEPEEVPRMTHWIETQTPELALQGLMCIPEASDNPTRLRGWFSRLRTLEAGCRPPSRGMLSMGMSQDFELAIAEGATHVRIGTALFGPRT